MNSALRGSKKDPSTARSLTVAALLAAGMLFGADALLFRTRLYPSILEPDSSTGLFELIFQRERAARGDNLVVALGDSRLALQTKVTDPLIARTGYAFRHAGVAGSELRAWYYMLRDLDPRADRYRAVVLAVGDYDDEDTYIEQEDDIRALSFALARLRLTDLLDFPSSFLSPPRRWLAYRGIFLKGMGYQKDVQAFLSHPVKRLEYVKLVRGGFADWTYNYNEDPRTMEGLQIDWTNWKATLPKDATFDQRDTVKGFLMRPVAPQTGHLVRYRRKWFGRIIDHYKGSATKIIFIRLPRGPIPRPESLVVKRSSSIREFAARPNVVLCDETAFLYLEDPRLFKDGMHLNREGCARFSTTLAEQVSRILGPPEH